MSIILQNDNASTGETDLMTIIPVEKTGDMA
jgi:hypothetical protein